MAVREANGARATPIKRDADPVAGMLPPHDLDAEAAVISACLLQRGAFAECAPLLRSQSFYNPRHQVIWGAFVELTAASTPIDTVTVCSLLQDTGRLAGAGGASYVADVMDKTPAVSNVVAHAEIVADKARMRAVVALADRVRIEGRGPVSDDWIATVVAAFTSAAAVPAQTRSPVTWVSAAEIAQPLPPVPWVVPNLQIGPGRPCSIQAYGGGMKTLVAASIAVACAAGKLVFEAFPCGRPKPVGIFDLEMGRRASSRRIQRTAIGMGVELASLPLKLAPLPKVRLTDPNAPDVLMRAVDGLELAIWDSLRAGLVGVDENDSGVRAYLDMLLEISERTGTTWVVLHHVGKTKDGHGDARQKGRGASAIFDAWGAVLDLTKESDNVRRVEMTKVHPEAEGPIDPFAIEVFDISDGGNSKAGVAVRYKAIEALEEAKPKAQTAFDALKSQIVALLRSGPQDSKNKICLRIKGGGKDVKLGAIDELVAEGRIVDLGGVYHAV